jgi:hypothetical protein
MEHTTTPDETTCTAGLSDGAGLKKVRFAAGAELGGWSMDANGVIRSGLRMLLAGRLTEADRIRLATFDGPAEAQRRIGEGGCVIPSPIGFSHEKGCEDTSRRGGETGGLSQRPWATKVLSNAGKPSKNVNHVGRSTEGAQQRTRTTLAGQKDACHGPTPARNGVKLLQKASQVQVIARRFKLGRGGVSTSSRHRSPRSRCSHR